MQRRALLAAAATLAAPRLSRAASGGTLRFVPHAVLASLDPHWNTAYVTRNHAFLVFDTLYGQDSRGRVSGQMVQGHVVDPDGLSWTLTLRDGLRWHDYTKVLARDCTASIRRWAAKDTFGQALLAATDELSAPDDRTIVFRLKRPFPLLPSALAKAGVYVPVMMPERLARTDPNLQVTEMVGSGPFRFVTAERVPGQRDVYERFPGYIPLPSGTPSGTAGPKIAYLDRVVWTPAESRAAAAAALEAGDVDWWEDASVDLTPRLRANSDIKVAVLDPAGQIAMMRMNWLQPPFNSQAIRQVVLHSVVQSDFMTAIMDDDRRLWRDGVGVFTPNSPLANDAGMNAITAPRDYDQLRHALQQAGYKGETVVALVPTDFPLLRGLARAGVAMLRRIGMVVDEQEMEWGTVISRRARRGPVSDGGWSVFFTYNEGVDQTTPATPQMFRGTGANAWFGWPDDPELERLRDAWFAAPDFAAQQDIARKLQLRIFQTVPFVPLGQFFQLTAYRTTLSGILPGPPVFWNIKKTD